MHALWSLSVVPTFVAAATCHALRSRASSNTYTLAKEYSGTDFFQGWDYYGAPDLLLNGMFCRSTHRSYANAHCRSPGDVNWVTEAQAVAEKLAYVNDAGHAIIKVDNTTYVQKEQKRDTVSVRGIRPQAPRTHASVAQLMLALATACRCASRPRTASRSAPSSSSTRPTCPTGAR